MSTNVLSLPIFFNVFLCLRRADQHLLHCFSSLEGSPATNTTHTHLERPSDYALWAGHETIMKGRLDIGHLMQPGVAWHGMAWSFIPAPKETSSTSPLCVMSRNLTGMASLAFCKSWP
ncbi:MAG: hypothetical protein BYD32DRAFT_404886 [Podila humilis]|nr:MAG: hypothetical protein BYD32DRAFT_404886 [Podila humilis]